MSEIISPDWRRRVAELARGAGKPHAPLWVPMHFSGAAQIEALPVADFVSDPTKLGKGLSELRRILGSAAIVTAVPASAEAEALGAQVNLGVWPPVITAAPGAAVAALADLEQCFANGARLQASLQATRRLAEAESGAPVLVAVLTGPAALAAQLAPHATPGELEGLYDFIGRFLAALVGEYAKAGAHAIVLREGEVGAEIQPFWQDALGPIANVARFHKMPPLLQYGAAAGPWPRNMIGCPRQSETGPVRGGAHALALPADPDGWNGLPDGGGNARIAMTDGEVAHTIAIAHLRERSAAM